MKVQNTRHFIQNNPSGASHHLLLHKGGFDSCKTLKSGFINTLKSIITDFFIPGAEMRDPEGG